jgi:hypothetical protein
MRNISSMLTYADVCWRMLTGSGKTVLLGRFDYAQHQQDDWHEATAVISQVRWRMLTYAEVCWRMIGMRQPPSYRRSADVCWRMLTYADVCWHVWQVDPDPKEAMKRLMAVGMYSTAFSCHGMSMYTYADVCWRMLTGRLLTYADVCWRMLTYADVCWRMLTGSMLTYADRYMLIQWHEKAVQGPVDGSKRLCSNGPFAPEWRYIWRIWKYIRPVGSVEIM